MRILLVEDQAWVRATVIGLLEAENHELECAGDALQALGILNERGMEFYDLIISDIMMPHITGIEFVKGLRANNVKTPIILISGGGYNMDAETMLETAQTIGNVVLKKPFTGEELLNAIHSVTSEK